MERRAPPEGSRGAAIAFQVELMDLNANLVAGGEERRAAVEMEDDGGLSLEDQLMLLQELEERQEKYLREDCLLRDLVESLSALDVGEIEAGG